MTGENAVVVAFLALTVVNLCVVVLSLFLIGKAYQEAEKARARDRRDMIALFQGRPPEKEEEIRVVTEEREEPDEDDLARALQQAEGMGR